MHSSDEWSFYLCHALVIDCIVKAFADNKFNVAESFNIKGLFHGDWLVNADDTITVQYNLYSETTQGK